MNRFLLRARAGLSALALACTFAAPARAQSTSVSVPVQNTPIIRIRLESGTLSIRTWDRQTVQITANGPVSIHHFDADAVARAIHSDDIPVFSTSVATHQGHVLLPPEEFMAPALSSAPHDGVVIAAEGAQTVTVTIPQQSALVWAMVAHGRIRLQDYRNGAFLLRVHTGMVALANVGGDGYAEAARGRITVENSAFDRFRARTAAGNIFFSNCNARQIEVSSAHGSIVYDNGTFVPGLARFETVTGDVALGIAGGGVQIGAHSASGQVRSNFTRGAATSGTANDVHATINGGGPVVTASSVSGSIYLYDGAFAARPLLQQQWTPLQQLFKARNAARRPYRV
ncbi:MAG TPA: DUF4097 family beta strand repeat-containing protein [Candidatus Baltobacteraceae bacterium]|nr:DUF4097 family beta strand repeat-containing protein [Candidatus Baltobacteraceae bacterium]